MSIVKKRITPCKNQPQKTKGAPCLLFVLLFLIFYFPTISGIAANPGPLKEITVVSDDNYPPYIFRDGERHLQGILVDEWRLWEEKTGIKVDLWGMDWDKAIKMMAEGNAEVIDTIFLTEERAKSLAFSAPYASIDVPIFFHRNISGISDVKSLLGFTIGVKAGDACIDFLKKHGIQTLREYANYESIVRDAAEQKIKVFCIDAPPAQYYLYKMNIDAQYRHTAPLYTGQFHRAVRKERKDLLKTVEEGFAKISRKEHEEIEKRWRGSSIALPYIAYLLYLMGIIVILGGILVLWNYTLRRKVVQKTLQLQEAIDALGTSENKYRLVVENAEEAILIAQDGFLKYANPITFKILGYSEEVLTSMPFVKLIHPEDREKLFEAHIRIMQGEESQPVQQFRVFTADGTVRWADSRAVTISWKGKPATLNFLTDITERKQQEEERRNMEDRLQRAEKMEALGQLAGGVAHDLNNVLGVLSGYSELLLMEIPEGSRSRGHVEKILKSTEKGAAIIQDLLTLARRGVAAVDVVNLNAVVEGFLKTPVFENIKNFHPRVTFRTEIDRGLLNIKGSTLHLEKTVMNLASNAAEAISGVGEVTIWTENRYLDRPLQGYDEVKEGDYVVLAVSDTGMGIPAENIGKIFEPFYTKKTMGRSGTGLGLAIVWGTVKDHNGYIDVQSRVDEGTTFKLYFPVTREELITPQQQAPLESYMGNGEAVLVVDDIAEQRDIAARLLTRLGYEVHAVSSGEEAVEYLRGNRADILVLDMIMAPGIDGLETYQRVLEINPQQKAIILSGFSATARVREAQRLGAGAYVKKPYIMEKIGVAIRDELNRK
jgi:PAS domain S-box-containing protein